jgi:hypothetical protein
LPMTCFARCGFAAAYRNSQFEAWDMLCGRSNPS